MRNGGVSLLEITCLNDDVCEISELENEHGLSLYIKKDDKKFLFDVGQGEAFKNNANKLGIDLEEIETLILSHGHYDHTGGLKFIDGKLKIVCHPNCTIWRKSKRTDRYNGIPFSKDELNERFEMCFSKDVYMLDEDVFFLGEINRKYDFECKKFPSVVEDGRDDIATDDSGIAIRTSQGLVIISGCGHSGICNTIEHAKKVTGEDRIFYVIGGFHLKEVDEQTEKTIKYMRDNNVSNLILGHCTSKEVCEEFEIRLKDICNVSMLGTGKKYILI